MAAAASALANDFYSRLGDARLSALWQTLHTLVPRQPAPEAVPCHWRYQDAVRPLLMEAGELISAREAERRVLVLENPARPGTAAVTGSIYAGFQLLLPGEVAPAHRHSQSALRFIIEGSNAFTTIDGDKILMEPGDVVLTPAWTWHNHGNETRQPMVWLDALDIPIVGFFNAGFAEPAHAESQAFTSVGDSSVRFGNNLAPVDWRPAALGNGLLNYPYLRTRETLAAMARVGAPDDFHGHKLRYVNPASGGHITPTVAAFVQLLPAGFATRPYRSTDGTAFCVVEGEGESLVGEQRISWKPHDVFVVPSWVPVEHRASGEAVLFSVSDRAAQEQLGLWRESRAA